MRVFILTLIMAAIVGLPNAASAYYYKGLRSWDSSFSYSGRKYYRGARYKKVWRNGYRTTPQPYLKKYFFPPYQFKVTGCSYNDYLHFRHDKGWTYRCWRRIPKYKKRWRGH